MQSRAPHPGLDGWQRLIGRWTTQATHPLLPGTVVRGNTTFEWLDGRQFLIQRSHYDHPEIPAAIAITGVTDGRLSMHYFDYRGLPGVCGRMCTISRPPSRTRCSLDGCTVSNTTVTRRSALN